MRCSILTKSLGGIHPLARRCLHQATDDVRRRWPFHIDEMVLLPDHFDLILTLPAGDDNFSTRVGHIKINGASDYRHTLPLQIRALAGAAPFLAQM